MGDDAKKKARQRARQARRAADKRQQKRHENFIAANEAADAKGRTAQAKADNRAEAYARRRVVKSGAEQIQEVAPQPNTVIAGTRFDSWERSKGV